MPPREFDSHWMQQALALAARGQGLVEPNPLVGCVLVAEGGPGSGELLGQGFHTRYGQAHAEREAIAHARQLGNANRLAGSTAYVTLEPCCHHGKTPPCTEALLEIGVARVVAALRDPFASVSGRGLSQLQSAGVEVTLGIEQAAAELLNAPYLKRLQTQRPWVIAKWAMSLDGKIATRCGDSQWISGPESRAQVQQLRGRVDAILIGVGTALADDPSLVARTPLPPARIAVRVVADSRLRLPLTSQLVTTARQVPVLIYAGPEASASKADELRSLGCQVHRSQECEPVRRLDELLQHLCCNYAATNVLVEGGGQLLGSLLELKQLDQCEVFVAPKLIGGSQALSPVGGLGLALLNEGPGHHAFSLQPCGADAHISCRLDWPT